MPPDRRTETETQRRARIRRAIVAVLVVAIAVFAALADELAEWQPFVSLDRHVDEELHESATPWVTTLMEDISFLGGTVGLLLVTLAATGILVMRRRLRYAVLVVLAYVGAQALDSVLKVEFARPRPSFASPVVPQASGYSFPSGHAAVSMAVYGALAYVAWTSVRRARARAACLAGALVLVGSIGFSRLYLGKHFPSDVIGGWCLALVWLGVLVLVAFPVGGPPRAATGSPPGSITCSSATST